MATFLQITDRKKIHINLDHIVSIEVRGGTLLVRMVYHVEVPAGGPGTFSSRTWHEVDDPEEVKAIRNSAGLNAMSDDPLKNANLQRINLPDPS